MDPRSDERRGFASDMTPMQILSAVVAELGSSVNDQDMALKNASNKGSLLRSLESIPFSCPALSLQHEEHTSNDSWSREQFVEHASSLLSREVASTESIENIPGLLRQNVSSSFAVLTDSRFRANAVFLARHGCQLAKKQTLDSSAILDVENKLETLAQVGDQISFESVFSRCEVQEEMNVDNDATGCVELPLHFEVDMELRVPRPDGESDIIQAKIRTTGSIKGMFKKVASYRKNLLTLLRFLITFLYSCSGTFSNESPESIQKIQVHLDTCRLLSNMMGKASTLFEQVVELTNDAFARKDPSFPRRESQLAMPPPLSKKGNLSLRPKWELPSQRNNCSIEQLDERVPMVSPDLSSNLSPSREIPNFAMLEQQQDSEEERVLAQLSSDQCADLVDGVLGEFDDSILAMGSPTKKMKVSG